ncbi:delta-like protein A [Dendronephthya gigantea]|uniref:delta-like protein A n=1 Tax=Dendronephthya gigantea TaxID=151771 RepID=UPI00106C00EA|nr:delta-like protein A [Dendronephthya gigantea]
MKRFRKEVRAMILKANKLFLCCLITLTVGDVFYQTTAMDSDENVEMEQTWEQQKIINLKRFLEQEDKSSDKLVALLEQPVKQIRVKRKDPENSGSGCGYIPSDNCASSPCSANANCTNTDDSYLCKCQTGYEGNGRHCTDVNECKSFPCGFNANCANTNGSYLCQCKPGYEGNGTNCTDVNECKSFPCGSNANCTNTNGSYLCKCQPGYEGSGINCTAVNYCENATCDSNANCTNTNGSYLCECQPGYKGNGIICTEVINCTNSPCGAKETCVRINDSYVCRCKTGYWRERTNCRDINECGAKNLCDSNAICNNTDGSYLCKCQPGYEGNGTNCKESSKQGSSTAESSDNTGVIVGVIVGVVVLLVVFVVVYYLYRRKQKVKDTEDTRTIKNRAYEPHLKDVTEPDAESPRIPESANRYEISKEPTYASLDNSKRDDENLYQSLTNETRDAPGKESEYASLKSTERDPDDDKQYQSLVNVGYQKQSEEDEDKDDYEEVGGQKSGEAITKPDTRLEKPDYAELDISKRDPNDENQYQSLTPGDYEQPQDCRFGNLNANASSNKDGNPENAYEDLP